jgi:hypothetical protein
MRNGMIIGAIVLGTLSGLAQAGTVKIETTAFNGGNGGGAFKATSLTGYNGETDEAGQFNTFCMEHYEGFSAGETYVTAINTQTVGAIGNVALSAKVAYLYTNYRLGTLAGFDNSPSDNGKLQEAIWALQGNIAAPAPATNEFYDLAHTSNWTDIGAVRVLNIFGSDGSMRQDQLTMVPLPPAAWAGLATMGVAAVVRRRSIKR